MASLFIPPKQPVDPTVEKLTDEEAQKIQRMYLLPDPKKENSHV
jgi:hypothetical protein